MRKGYVKKTKAAPRVFGLVPQHNWADLILELNRAGYPKNQIALGCNCTREMIYSMLKGHTPPWDIGQAVLVMIDIKHKQEIQKSD